MNDGTEEAIERDNAVWKGKTFSPVRVPDFQYADAEQLGATTQALLSPFKPDPIRTRLLPFPFKVYLKVDSGVTYFCLSPQSIVFDGLPDPDFDGQSNLENITINNAVAATDPPAINDAAWTVTNSADFIYGIADVITTSSPYTISSINIHTDNINGDWDGGEIENDGGVVDGDGNTIYTQTELRFLIAIMGEDSNSNVIVANQLCVGALAFVDDGYPKTSFDSSGGSEQGILAVFVTTYPT